MNARRRLTVALVAAAMGSTLATAPAGAEPTPRRAAVTSAAEGQDVPPLVAPVLGAPDVGRAAASASYRRPLFAFWPKKYNRIDGFGFTSAIRGSGSGVTFSAAWKTYRGTKPILPKKVFVQARVDGGKWTKVSGAKGRISRKGLVTASVPPYTVTPGVPVQSVDYRFKTKKIKQGPRKARRSTTSGPITVQFDNQAMYTGDQARFYAPIANLCPQASVTLDPTGTITTVRDAAFSFQYGIAVQVEEINAVTWESEASKMAVAIHECAHYRQFTNWGATRAGWARQEKAAAAVFVPDDNPSGPTPPMQPDWAPLEHAADCATFLVTTGAERTYGGYCNPAENAAAGLLWQGQRY